MVRKPDEVNVANCERLVGGHHARPEASLARAIAWFTGGGCVALNEYTK
jgi:hypothetical protein